MIIGDVVWVCWDLDDLCYRTIYGDTQYYSENVEYQLGVIIDIKYREKFSGTYKEYGVLLANSSHKYFSKDELLNVP